MDLNRHRLSHLLISALDPWVRIHHLPSTADQLGGGVTHTASRPAQVLVRMK